MLNLPTYRRSARHGLRFWDAASVGINVETPDELPDAIDRALEDPPEVAAARERALSVVYQPRSGGAQIAVDALMEWASQPAPLRPQQRIAARSNRLYARTRG